MQADLDARGANGERGMKWEIERQGPEVLSASSWRLLQGPYGHRRGHVLRASWDHLGVDICKGRMHPGFAECLLCARHHAKGFLHATPSLPLNRSWVPVETPRRERL